MVPAGIADGVGNVQRGGAASPCYKVTVVGRAGRRERGEKQEQAGGGKGCFHASDGGRLGATFATHSLVAYPGRKGFPVAFTVETANVDLAHGVAKIIAFDHAGKTKMVTLHFPFAAPGSQDEVIAEAKKVMRQAMDEI